MTRLEELIEKYPVRRSYQQKKAFREYVISAAEELGAEAKVEKTCEGKNENVVIGDVEHAKVVFTAHYDTPAASLFPNVMIPRNKPLFYLYQFAPIICILLIGLAGGFAVQAWTGGNRIAFLIAFMVIYYGAYFLMYRTFTNKNNYNDNTSGTTAVLTLLDRLESEKRREVAFILFDNEEKGKKGSKAYFQDHGEYMKDKLLINFDCVGYGDQVIFIAKEGAEQKSEYASLCESFLEKDGFVPHFYPMKGSESNSDYKNFPCGIGCMTCKKGKNGLLYTPRIHTAFDTVANNENIEYIADGICGFINKI